MTTWQDLYNYHVGETGLVIGNGPSLKDIPLPFLQQFPSIGSNRIYLLEDFTPTYYVCVNPLVIEQFSNDINKMQCQAKFISIPYSAQIAGSLALHSTSVPTFSKNPEKYIYEGFTVTYAALQLAYWMGFSTILLVGVDHSYTYQGAPNEEHILHGTDPNHFSPDYFSGAKWNNPDLKQSEHAYKMAKVVFEGMCRKIINCTTTTALDIFEQEDWQCYAKSN